MYGLVRPGHTLDIGLLSQWLFPCSGEDVSGGYSFSGKTCCFCHCFVGYIIWKICLFQVMQGYFFCNLRLFLLLYLCLFLLLYITWSHIDFLDWMHLCECYLTSFGRFLAYNFVVLYVPRSLNLGLSGICKWSCDNACREHSYIF